MCNENGYYSVVESWNCCVSCCGKCGTDFKGLIEQTSKQIQIVTGRTFYSTVTHNLYAYVLRSVVLKLILFRHEYTIENRQEVNKVWKKTYFMFWNCIQEWETWHQKFMFHYSFVWSGNHRRHCYTYVVNLSFLFQTCKRKIPTKW